MGFRLPRWVVQTEKCLTEALDNAFTLGPWQQFEFWIWKRFPSEIRPAIVNTSEGNSTNYQQLVRGGDQWNFSRPERTSFSAHYELNVLIDTVIDSAILWSISRKNCKNWKNNDRVRCSWGIPLGILRRFYIWHVRIRRWVFLTFLRCIS